MSTRKHGHKDEDNLTRSQPTAQERNDMPYMVGQMYEWLQKDREQTDILESIEARLIGICEGNPPPESNPKMGDSGPSLRGCRELININHAERQDILARICQILNIDH